MGLCLLLPTAALPLVGVGVAQASSGDSPGTIYVADQGNNSIEVFGPGATGNVAPIRVISGTDTGLNSPWGVQVDAAGNVFVSNFFANTITEYAPQASGDVTPVCTISGSNTGLDEPGHFSLLPDGTLVVANATDAAGDTGAITVYPPGSCGNVTPVETIAGTSTTLNGPAGVGVDATGTIFVANPGATAIDAFDPGASGNVAPPSSVTGAATGLGALTDLRVAFDGTLYALNGAGSSTPGVEAFAAGASGGVAPASGISGANTDFGSPTGLSVDLAGNIVVADASATVGGTGVGPAVLRFTAGANGNVAPADVINGSSTTLSSPEGVFVTGAQASSSATLSTMTTGVNIGVPGTTTNTATLTGGAQAPTGAVVFRLYGPGDPACSGKPAFTSSPRQVTGDGSVSASFAPTQAGSYSWVAAYSGDDSNVAVTTACNQPAQTVLVGVTPTTMTTSLIFNGQATTSVSAPAGQPVFDQASLAGQSAGIATGTITYNVYSDAACTQLVSSGAPLPVSAGDPAQSQGMTLNTPGTYYWQAVYSGDSSNGGSSSTCGPNGEVETVTPGGSTTTLTTTLTGSGGQSGNPINVDTNTSVTDKATLGGQFAGSATGTVTYTVYSDLNCATVAAGGMTETITNPGALPPSPPVTLPVGTYYWKASYSGDPNNAAAASTCGPNGEVENVAPGTTVTTTLSSGDQSGTTLTVGQGASVTDSATLSGPNVATATGTVTYNVYSDSACTSLFTSAGPLTITTPGTLPPSGPVTMGTPGTFYWQAVYSGDAKNSGSASTCGGETVTVNEVPQPTQMTTLTAGGGQSGPSITVPEGTTVADQATLAGTNATSATGNVTFSLYSDAACANLVSGGSLSAPLSGAVATSAGITLSTPGTYYWTASYAGDAGNLASASGCGAETVIVTSQVLPKALVLADSVTVPGPSPAPFSESLEQYEAEHDGYTVTSVTGTQWDSMTTAQFAQYQVLIIGDNTCSGESEFDAAVTNETTWEPVVMNSGGNKVLIGTDPVYHYTNGSAPNADKLLANGIAFAGNVAGATGAYVDLSCAYDASALSTPVPLLDGLSTHGAGQFTVVGDSTVNACATGVNIVAQTGPTSGLTDADLSNWECSVHEAFQTFPSDYTPLALAPSSSGFPKSYCADDVTDPTVGLACGSPYIMVSGGGVIVKSQITLAPATQTVTVGGTASLTATVTANGSPVSGATVVFSVDSGPNVGITSTATTDSSGQATFSYSGKTAGTDQVSATYTVGSVSQKALASVTWQPPQPTTVTTSLSGGDHSGATITVFAGTSVTDSATLAGANASTATGTVTYTVYADAACTKVVNAGVAEPITTPGTLPSSAPVTLTMEGTYYWTAAYSGDAANAPSTSPCGSETETVTPAPTSLTTQLASGSTSGTTITVPAGSPVTDTATLTGGLASTATGTVTYTVYADANCAKVVNAGAVQSITTPGTMPSSAPVTLTTPGTYYWQAVYSGDTSNAAATSSCGTETETVTAATAQPTSLTTSLSGGDHSGPTITVFAGTSVTDSATLTGANASTATGAVTYTVYSDANCTQVVRPGTAEKIVTPGTLPPSAAVTLSAAGTYHWTASYSGDGNNQPSVSPCGSETETVTPAPTSVATSLSSGDSSGPSITVSAGSSVTDSATLSGAVASTATGMVTYTVYSDANCTQVVSPGAPQTITMPGVLPGSSAVPLNTAGTYYWQAAYSGDGNNQPSVSPCGSETAMVTPAVTSLVTQLSSGSTSGMTITVPSGSPVTDTATLSGAVANTAMGTVTYTVYSDANCTQVVSPGTAEKIVTPGTLPPSAAVTLSAAGTYYWQAAYSGDLSNQPSVSACGSETETVTKLPTSVSTSLSGGGQAGATITVPAGTSVTDTATLSGAGAKTATGTITYNVYSDAKCTVLVAPGKAQAITAAGILPASALVTLGTVGTYYWTATYSGDASNQPFTSSCGSETERVIIADTTFATSLSGGGQSGAAIMVPAGTSVTDSATLSGPDASAATGTVTYTVYSDNACTNVVSTGTAQPITTPGQLPASKAVPLFKVGTYYWTATYSGDGNNKTSSSPCGAETVTVTIASTMVATSLSGGDSSGPAITVPQNSPVTDSATLSGTDASGATGMVTYNVYSDNACKLLVNGGTAEKITTPGTLPPSLPVTLTKVGTYYWQAVYSGDGNNKPSSSVCGSETEIVSLAVLPTTLATSLSGGGVKPGPAITVQAGTPVTDTATLSGINAATASGTVIYNVYSDNACKLLVKGGTAEKITTLGTLPPSLPVTLTVAGTYYWQAAYSGDIEENQASDTTCGSEVETVTPATTALTTSLTGGGKTGTAITVQVGTPVADSATLSGAVVAGATGTVTYKVYSNATCTTLAALGGTEIVAGGKVPNSLPVKLTLPGTYYWTASYLGDKSDLPSASPCGSEKLTVIPLPAIDTLTTAWGKGVATAKVSTTAGGDVVVAFVAGNGPGTKLQTATVSGGGLTWHLASRHNPAGSDTEVWTAKAAGKLTGVSVTVKGAIAGFDEVMTVVAFKNATGLSPSSSFASATGAPHAALKTTMTNSWVFAVGADWATYVKPTPASGQFLLSQVDAPGTKTAWVQATTALTPVSGTTVTISDTQPTTHPYVLLLVAIH